MQKDSVLGIVARLTKATDTRIRRLTAHQRHCPTCQIFRFTNAPCREARRLYADACYSAKVSRYAQRLAERKEAV